MSDLVLSADAAGVRTITINRPAKKNSLTQDMYDALGAAIRAADSDDAVAVICLAGAGDSFTVGNDIDDFLAAPPPVSRQRGPGGLFTAVAHAQKPVLAAVNGMAVGIDTTLLLHCDLVYAGRSAKLRLPFVSIGLVPEGGSTALLPHLVGRRRASEAFFFGDWIDAEKALSWGLLNEVVDDDALLPTLQERAARLARQPARLLRETKRLLSSPSDDLLVRMDLELGLLGRQIAQPEAQEAFAALKARRAPDFSRFR